MKGTWGAGEGKTGILVWTTYRVAETASTCQPSQRPSRRECTSTYTRNNVQSVQESRRKTAFKNARIAARVDRQDSSYLDTPIDERPCVRSRGAYREHRTLNLT